MIYLRAYLNENLGDDLFVQIIAQRYPKIDLQIFASDDYPVKFENNVHFCFTKKEYSKLQNEVKIYDNLRNNKIRRKLLPIFFRPDFKKRREIAKKADINIYVIGSGFMEGGKRGFWQRIEDRLYFSKKPYLLGCNFGPFFSSSYKKQYEKLFSKAKDICFRDSYSYNLFKKLNNIRWESDIVFSYNGNVDESFSKCNEKYIVISVVNLGKDGTINPNEDLYYEFVSEIAEWFLKRKIKVVFVGFCKNQGDDVAVEKVLKRISSQLIEQVEIINYPQNNIPYILGVFKNAESVFASRYHAGIIGMLFEKKTYFLSYSDKIVNVLRDIDENIKYIDINKKINIKVEDFILHYGYCISAERLSEIKESSNRQFIKLDSVLK
ncbi:MAG: polysaccharide pyruvyl transferase family protein [Anaerobutyricum hallii]|nr:polysaccharide pyruvyl transferase family protein [Anaerobutyricum hallii]